MSDWVPYDEKVHGRLKQPFVLWDSETGDIVADLGGICCYPAGIDIAATHILLLPAPPKETAA